ncbi:unnamed protein product [Ectocarpus sp. 12 AP-2014]
MAAADRDAMVTFFHSTGGTSWERNTLWNTTAKLSIWYGIKVDAQGRVVELDLAGNNLRGSFPKQLLTLTQIGSLILDGNKLTGKRREVFCSFQKMFSDPCHALSGQTACSTSEGRTLRLRGLQ